MDSALVDLFGVDLDEECCTFKKLPPEVEEGNIEYKLKLIDPTPTRFEHLVTQMKWRLEEGFGEAIYEIGVEDNGSYCGLSEDEMSKSMETLKAMANRLGASLTIIREHTFESSAQELRKSAEVLIRKVPDDQQFIDVRVAVIGNVESGKSTMIGVLTQNESDNGRGKARLNLFRHLHEVQTGHTSSINNEILGFNNQGQVVNYGNSRTPEEICENSSKIVTFIDLAGHSKYIKTTVFGLSCYAPDYTMLLISANNGIAGTTKEHLGFTLLLEVPVFIVVNKIDLCSKKQLTQTLQTIQSLLKSPGVNKMPFLIDTDDDAVVAAQTFTESKICPIFTISCVTGENLDRVKKFLNVLPPLLNKTECEKNMQQPTHFRVDEVYTNQTIGNIVAGMLMKGTIQENEKLLLGPFDNGDFVPVNVTSVHRHRAPCRIVRGGQFAAVSLGHCVDKLSDKLRKGMVLVNEQLNPKACFEFEADIYLLYHASKISKGFQVTVHVGNVCQTVILTSMDKDSIKTNEKAKAVFRFQSRPEYLTIGSRLIFREGTCKGLGEITNIFPVGSQTTANPQQMEADSTVPI